MQVVSFATAHFDGNRGWHRRSNGNKPWPTSVILILCIACYAEHDKTRLPWAVVRTLGDEGDFAAFIARQRAAGKTDEEIYRGY